MTTSAPSHPASATPIFRRRRVSRPRPAARERAAAAGRVATEPCPTVPQAGRYELRRTIGQGGMGAVYEAWDPELARRVAVKLMRPRSGPDMVEAQARLRREAQSMAALSHPNVLGVYDVGLTASGVFLAMPLVDGPNLSQWLRRRRPSWSQVLEVFIAAGQGLVAAHAARIVHRDFKPTNVLIDQQGGVFVCDFGVAAFINATDTDDPTDEDDAGTRLTRRGSTMGTPAYMAPEQHEGGPVDARSDQFSFCVALYEALYGQMPFPGGTSRELWKAKRQRRPRPPRRRGIPRRVFAVVERGLAGDPDLRYPDLSALLADLRRVDARRRIWRAAVPTAICTAAALGILAAISGEGLPRRCVDEERAAALWSPEIADDVEDAFVRTGLPHAPQSFRRVEAHMQEYQARWIAQRTEVCEAGTEHDPRLECLDRALEREVSLAAALRGADSDVVRAAAGAVASRPGPERCTASPPLPPAPSPDDATLAARVAMQRAHLERAREANLLGHHAQAQVLAREVLVHARALRFAPLVAEAALLEGQSTGAQGRYQDARLRLEEAALEASAANHDRVAAEAATALILVVGEHLSRPEQVERWETMAKRSLGRMGHPPRLELALRHASAAASVMGGHFEVAVESMRDLLDNRGEQLDEIMRAEVLTVLGNGEQRRGRTIEARAAFSEAVRVWRTAVGDAHPMLGLALVNLANIERKLDAPLALRYAEEALAIAEGLEAHEPRLLASALSSSATILLQRGELAEGRARLLRAAALIESSLGAENPQLAWIYNNLAMAAVAQDDPEAARKHHQRAIALLETHFGATSPHLYPSLTNLASLELDEGHPGRARTRLNRVLEIIKAKLGPKHPGAGYAWALLAKTEQAEGNTTAALQALDRSTAQFEAAELPIEAAASRFERAKVMGEDPATAQAAIKLARRAQADLAGRPHPVATQVHADISAWLDEHVEG